MRYFLDTEFDEDGKTIELISIGIARSDGATLYIVSNEFNPSKCDEWVKTNVLTKLRAEDTYMSRANIAAEVSRFVGADPKPEFWGYFADYDWVVFCRLWGRMIDLPKGFPMFCLDIKQWATQLGVNIKDAVPQPPNAHNALADAMWNMAAHSYLSEHAERMTAALRVERDELKRRAVAHGCDAENGDPDCG